MRDEDYFYPHFGLFNEGAIRISPTFVASDTELGLLRALNIVHRDWTSNVVRVNSTAGGGSSSSYEYRGICDFNDSVETSFVAGVCSLNIFESPEDYKMILQLEPGQGDGAVTFISLKRDPPCENFLGWILKKSIDVARSGNKTLRNLDRSFISEEGTSMSRSARLDESTVGDMVKNSEEFKEMVMEYMSRDAATFAAAESQLENLGAWFRDQRTKLSNSVLEMSRHDASLHQDQSLSRTPTHSPSRLSSVAAPASAGVSSPYKEAEAKQSALVREQMDKFRENVEKSIDSAFANSLESSEDVLVKLYYTGKDPRIPEEKKLEYQYVEGADPASFTGYVQERQGVTSVEAHAADEELEGRNHTDYQQLKRALGRFQGDVESLIKESFEENEDYRRSLGLDSSFQANLSKVGVYETPLRKSKGSGRAVDDDGEDKGDEDDDEVTVEEEAAEVQAILQGFLLSHHREDWGHTSTKPHPAHPSHPSHPHHHLHRKHSTPHYMMSTESSSHHEVDLSTKLHVHESMELEEGHRAAHHKEQQMIDSIFGHTYDAARHKDKHHGVHSNGHTAHPSHVQRSRTASTASINSASTHTSVASTRTHTTTSSSPTKKVTKVSSSLLAPTAASKAHHSPEVRKSVTSSPTKSKSSSVSTSSSSSAHGHGHKTASAGSKTGKVSSAASVDSHDTSHSKASAKSVASSVATKKAEKMTAVYPAPSSSPLVDVLKIAAEIPVDDKEALPTVAPSLNAASTSVGDAGSEEAEGEEDSPSPFGLISEVSSIGPAAQGTTSGFASPASGGGAVAPKDAHADEVVSLPAAGVAGSNTGDGVSASTVAAATLASLEAHYEEEGGGEDDVNLESSADEAEAAPPAAPTEPSSDGNANLNALLGISESGAADTTTASQERRQHDASWEPARETYLQSTFASTQREQDDYTKAHTLGMIFDEEKARHRHHKDIMDPEKAYAREQADSVSVTSSISDWTVEKETKKKVKRLKKGTKKVTKRK